ncbi:hypothetical protein [Salinibacterium sp. PAMC 21357]|uniref:hypothetical protein n=1 Tax=Salinibacterium sp. PAMC 21357 TaxID=1112215 RepID=UPI000289F70B|nr:hypothetical protein [Salinibacterium sp. PAMC 21357]
MAEAPDERGEQLEPPKLSERVEHLAPPASPQPQPQPQPPTFGERIEHYAPPAYGQPFAPVPPPTFTPAPAKRSHAKLFLGAGALLAVILVGALVHATASTSYDVALEDFQVATQISAEAHDVLRITAATATDAGLNADSIAAASTPELVDPVALTEFTSAADELAELVVVADKIDSDRSTFEVARKPTFAWDVWREASDLRAHILTHTSETADADAAQTLVQQSQGVLTEKAVVLFKSAVAAGPAFEAAHLSARNDQVIAFRVAREDLDVFANGVDSASVDKMEILAAAAIAVTVSEQAELAEKAGPLEAQRFAAEAFARSLAGGVLLEFDWSPIVNGYGQGDSLGGLTTWWSQGDNRAVIELSDSTARLWPSDRSQALVAHEVGHAISSKCPTMLDISSQDSIEQFATAWALSHGHTAGGNGVSIYGYPPQSVIDLAATCR